MSVVFRIIDPSPHGECVPPSNNVNDIETKQNEASILAFF
jgi:hypothetical protein